METDNRLDLQGADLSDAPTDPSIFDAIGLSMSGGGFRAAAYGLGTLRGLHLLGLLGNVQLLSTISGGTITGAYYALRRKRGDSFETIYQDLHTLLMADEILPRALANWKTAINSQQHQYKLIRAFADVYDEHLYGHALFGEFFDSPATTLPIPPLQTVVFGATELYSGTAFRFQYADLPDKFTTSDNVLRQSYRIGNGNVNILHERARNLRLSDMVAASSCFPGGFEPLVLPDDFPGPDTTNMLFFSGTDAQLPINRLALLDGGVYDNQGIEGLLGAERRNRTYRESKEGKERVEQGAAVPKPTTLFLIADVASAGIGLYQAPELGPARGSDRSFKKWAQLANKVKWGLLIAFCVVGILQLSVRHGGSFSVGLMAGIVLSGLGLVLAGIWACQWLIDKVKEADPTIFQLALPPLRLLTLGQLIYLLRIRASSVFELLNSVFLRRGRSQNYGLLFDDEENNDTEPAATKLFSIIGSLLKDYRQPFLRDRLQPVIETIQTASDMSTTLWWLADKHRMKAIIDSAQITLYWRIIRYFERRKRQAEKDHKPFVISARDQAVYEQAKKLLWENYGVK